jgi:hypothetical protein
MEFKRSASNKKGMAEIESKTFLARCYCASPLLLVATRVFPVGIFISVD